MDDKAAIPDDPEADGTDFAHPAWWRGADAASAGVGRIWQKALDGEGRTGVVAMPLLQQCKERTHALVDEVEKLRARVAGLERAATPSNTQEIAANPDDHWAVVTRIVAGALHGDVQKVRAYVSMLADRVQDKGDASLAHHLRTLRDDRPRIVKAMGEQPSNTQEPTGQ